MWQFKIIKLQSINIHIRSTNIFQFFLKLLLIYCKMSQSSQSYDKIDSASADSLEIITSQGRYSDKTDLPPNMKSKIEFADGVFAECIEKLRVAVVLPELVANLNQLRKLLTPMQIVKLKKYCENYIDGLESDSGVDYNLIKAIEVVYNNKKVGVKIQEYFDFLPTHLQQFVSSVYEICQIIKARLKTSFSMELHREKFLHNIYHKTKRTKENALAIKNLLVEKEVGVQWKLAEKQALISKYQRDLSDRKWQNNIMIQTEILSANRKMNTIWKDSETFQAKLQQEADLVQKDYQVSIKENDAVYKELKEKKWRKILSQLEAWIRKYDTNVGEKIRENENLKVELMDRTKKFEEFFEKYQIQEAIYMEVVNAKESEEKMIQEERLMMFMMNRAARIIQRVWRKHLRSKRKRGKGKRGKKGKK